MNKKQLEKAFKKHQEKFTFTQKSFPMHLTFDGVLVAEAHSSWRTSQKNASDYYKKDTMYRTSFLLYRNLEQYYLVKRGESSDSNDTPYEDVYSFFEFETLRNWIVDPSCLKLKFSRPVMDLVNEVVECGEFLTDEEHTLWVECFLGEQ